MPCSSKPGRRLVDVLGDGHQLSPGLSDRQIDRYVVCAVARQAIDLMDDDVLDGMLSDEGKHPL